MWNIHSAVKNKKLNILKYIIYSNNDIPFEEREAFSFAIMLGNLEVVKFLISKSAHIHNIGEDVIQSAVLEGQTKIKKYLKKYLFKIFLKYFSEIFC